MRGTRQLRGRTTGRTRGDGAVGRAEPQQLVFAFISTHHDLPKALSGIRAVTGETPLIGCTSYGEFANGASGKGGVSVALVASDNMSITIGAGRNLNGDDLSDTVAEVLKGFAGLGVQASPYKGRTLFLFTDGLAGGAETLVHELMTQTGMNYQLFGGAAADDIAFKETHVFMNGEASRMHSYAPRFFPRVLSASPSAMVGLRHPSLCV